MKKFLIFAIAGATIITISILVVNYMEHKSTKASSPEEEVMFTDSKADVRLKIFYNRPFKRNRVIFGELVPYGKVWRTGANEATIFETNKTLTVDGKNLMPGKYTLWTIPDSTTWTIILNSQVGQWGINHLGEANRDPQLDVLTFPAHAIAHDKVFEQFTISFEKVGENEAEMVLLWDNTMVTIPFTY